MRLGDAAVAINGRPLPGGACKFELGALSGDRAMPT